MRTIFSFAMYAIIMTFYLAFMSYQDKIARNYNEYWLYQDKDIKYVLGMEKCLIVL